MPAAGRALCESLLCSALSHLISPPAWRSRMSMAIPIPCFHHEGAFSEEQSQHASLCCSGNPAHTQPKNDPVTLRCVKILAKTNVNKNILLASPSPFFLLKRIKIQIILLKLIFNNDFFSACCSPVVCQAAIQLFLISHAHRDTN